MERSFEVNGVKYFITSPNAKAIREADWVYSKIYTKALMDGIPTSSEMVDLLKKRGIIGPEYEARAQELADMLDETLIKMANTEDPEEKKALALKAADLRNEIFLWNQRFNGPLANTCEQMADDARLECLTSHVVVDEKGNRVWDSYDAFLEERDSTLASTAKLEVMLFLQGLDSDFLEKTPEAEVIRELTEAESAESSTQTKKRKKTK